MQISLASYTLIRIPRGVNVNRDYQSCIIQQLILSSVLQNIFIAKTQKQAINTLHVIANI